MATVVSISNTPHLTYSPMNEKHNILYKRIRQNAYQRYKQTPWFNLNPLVHKEIQKGTKLDHYKPDIDTGLVPLQSLIIVENYFDDKYIRSRELSIKEFWDFLFSDEWANGYSLRVLEGQLHQLLVTCLVSLNQAGSVVQHSTLAYAKNTRKRPLSDETSLKEQDVRKGPETLVLEFIYYGQVVERPDWEETATSYDYPASSTTHSSSGTRLSTDTEFSNAGSVCEKNAPLQQTPAHLPTPPSEPPAQTLAKQFRRRKHEASAKLRFLQPQTDREHCTIVPFFHPDFPAPVSRYITRGINCYQTCSNFSSSSDEYRCIPALVDLNKFACTENATYLGEFDLPDDSSGSEDEDDYSSSEDDFGQQLYLGDVSGQDKNKQRTWKMRKGAWNKNRELWMKELSERKPVLPNLSDLDVKNYVTKTEGKPEKSIRTCNNEIPSYEEPERKHIKLKLSEKRPTLPKLSELDVQKHVTKTKKKSEKVIKPYSSEVPSLEEYAEFLEAERRRERRMKLKLKLKKLLKAQMLAEMFRKKFTLKTASSPSESKIVFWTPDAFWTIPKPVECKNKLTEMFRKPEVVRNQQQRKLEIPIIYITTATGHTYLHPLSQKILRKKKKEAEKERKKHDDEISSKRRSSLRSGSSTDVVREVSKTRNFPNWQNAQSYGNTAEEKMFPKAEELVTGMESPDEASDDESRDDSDAATSTFDVKKLNVQYSLLKMREATKEKEVVQEVRVGPPENTAHVLKKFSRMHSILRAFGKTSIKQPKKSAKRESKTAGQFKPRQTTSVFKESLKEGNDTGESDFGKLKHFKFLDKPYTVSRPDVQERVEYFDQYPAGLFQENLERALETFVVRREIVVSDRSGKVSASVTFTKKSVFMRSKYAQ